jgi:hypothetical protein
MLVRRPIRCRHAGAEPVEGTLANIERLLDRAVVPDALHFAMHGFHDPEDSGWAHRRTQTRSREMVRGYTLASAPFVFPKRLPGGQRPECRSGAAAGVAPAFLRAGASAVIAPLWSVSDSIAKSSPLWFYEQLRGGILPRRRPRDAYAVSARGDGRLASDSLAFRLYGHPKLAVHFDPRPVNPVVPVAPAGSASSAAPVDPAGSAGTTA